MSRRVVIIPTGTANTASVVAAFRRLGAIPVIAADVADVETADRMVLPGVGSFGAAMAEIERRGLRDAILDHIRSGKPSLAICVGMQLLAEKSDESPGIGGLGLLAATVTRFEPPVRVPHMGWNRVVPAGTPRFIEPGWAYFANSYRIATLPEGWKGAVTDYGAEFASALQKDSLLACQFHPELSGAWGRSLLGRWLASTGGTP